ncbi:hypothetical protein [Rhodococcus sp. B10]|uniref:VG15 protein n=1 Tax=Rhodococcus sp. B10 TaxID=2695876 RepID=UPI0014306C69|nr:hypothetical protein [Rhodococcus sp. B10]NIL74409.1 hypothetical protein [Rhodococcus sp. B10]
MPLPDAAGDYWLGQQRITAATLAMAKRLWRKIDETSFDESWDRMSPTLIVTVEQAQAAAIREATAYVPTVLDELNIAVDPVAALAPDALVGVTGAGIAIEEAAYNSIIKAKSAVAEGVPAQTALSLGGQYLQMLVQTALADTARAAESIQTVTRPSLGYVRMLNPPSCSRCVILAGRFYRWNAGFKRHPRCDCKSIPAPESIADDLTVDPKRYFDSLSPEEQDRTFGVSSAQAIRDGADMGQVVNAARGLQQAQVYGRQLEYTTEGTTKRGVAGRIIRARGRSPRTTPRLMPSAIYDIAEDRADALRLLHINGYLLDRDGVPLSGRGSRSGITAAAAPDFSVPPPKSAVPLPAPVETQLYNADMDAATYWQVRDNVERYPEHLRERLGEAGVTVQLAPKLTETAGGSKWAGVQYADGRTFDDMNAVYDESEKAVLLNGNLVSGSTNTVFHEMSHAVDNTALQAKPLDVDWQEPGQDRIVKTISTVSDDPYLIWAHNRVYDAGLADPYYRVGSMNNKASGRSEWFAESVAAIINNDPVQLLKVSAFDSQAIDVLRWSLTRILDL